MRHSRAGFTFLELLIALVILIFIWLFFLGGHPFMNVKRESAVTSLKSSLVKLVQAQESQHLARQSYVPALDSLTHLTGYVPDENVRIVMEPSSATTPKGFVATASHEKHSDVCMVAYGEDVATGRMYTGKVHCAPKLTGIDRSEVLRTEPSQPADSVDAPVPATDSATTS